MQKAFVMNLDISTVGKGGAPRASGKGLLEPRVSGFDTGVSRPERYSGHFTVGRVHTEQGRRQPLGGPPQASQRVSSWSADHRGWRADTSFPFCVGACFHVCVFTLLLRSPEGTWDVTYYLIRSPVLSLAPVRVTKIICTPKWT